MVIFNFQLLAITNMSLLVFVVKCQDNKTGVDLLLLKAEEKKNIAIEFFFSSSNISDKKKEREKRLKERKNVNKFICIAHIC